MVSPLTMPFLKEHVLPFKIREKIPYRIERIISAAASTLLFYIAKLKSRLGIASLKDRLRLADSFLVDGITLRNIKKENEIRDSYSKKIEDHSLNPMESAFFYEITTRHFIYIKGENSLFENIPRVRKINKQKKQKLFNKLNALVDQKFHVLVPEFFHDIGPAVRVMNHIEEVFGKVQFKHKYDSLKEPENISDKKNFIKNFSCNSGLIVDTDRYRLIFHSIYHFNFEEQKQEGVVGCRWEYIFTKEDVQAFHEDLKTEEMFPNLKAMGICSPMIFCNPDEATDDIKEQILHDLNKDVPRVIDVLE